MRISGRSALLAATLATSTMACLADPAAESPRTGATEQALDSSVALHENFFPDGDPGQCGGTGMQSAAMGNWTSNVFIDADNRSGGCQQQFGVTDPEGLLAGLSLAVNFFGDGDAGQCGNSGRYDTVVEHAVRHRYRWTERGLLAGVLAVGSQRCRNGRPVPPDRRRRPVRELGDSDRDHGS
jgi:hypothetical protein